MDSILILKTIMAYWCHSVAPQYEERFYWSYEKIEEYVEHIGSNARNVLLLLAESSPSDSTDAYFAAGPLESYINLVVKKESSEEAAFVMSNPLLNKLLPLVWGDKEKLVPLSKSNSKNISSDFKALELPIQIDLRTLSGFWCHMSTSKQSEEFEKYYNSIMSLLFDTATRDSVVNDLKSSSPDEKASKFLEENILILHP